MSVETGAGVLVLSAIVGTAAVLGRAGVAHMWDPTPLAVTVFGGANAYSALLVRLWGLVEVVLGGGLVAAVVWPGLWAAALAVAAVVVLVGYAVWLSVRARSSRLWCSCTSSQAPVNLAAILRPLVIAGPVVALAVLSWSGNDLLAGMAPVEMSATVFAGLGLGLVGWFYPEAVAVPTARQQWASPQIVEGWLGCLVGFFVVDGAGHVEGGVESVVVVPAVDPVGDVLSGLGFGLVFAV